MVFIQKGLEGLVASIILLTISSLSIAKSYNWSDISEQQYINNLVSCQTQLLEYKWSKNIWPEVNKKPKPAFSEIVEVEKIRKKVIDDLYKQNTLSKKFNIDINMHMLQHDIERMARNTKNAHSLNQQFALFDNDPITIAHCISRHYLVSKKIQNSYNWNNEIHQKVNNVARQELKSYLSSKNNNEIEAQVRIEIFKLKSDESEDFNLDIELSNNIYIHLTPVEFKHKLKKLNNATLQEHEYAFTYKELINQSENSLEVKNLIWSKQPINQWLEFQEKEIQILSLNAIQLDFPNISEVNNQFNIKSEPTIADTWTIQDVPNSRRSHTSVWTGSEMIVWGGHEGNFDDELTFTTGGRYDPSTDSWTATNFIDAPSGRFFHSAVWTGSEMIIWGGSKNQFIKLNTGGRYNPISDSWSNTSLVNVPSGRSYPSVVWTGSEMIIWGGPGTITGSRYNPESDIWSETSIIDAPSARAFHTAIWTGSEMIVWGGNNTNTGSRYDPNSDSWLETSISDAPSARGFHTAIWTGSEMIVWGGNNINTGSRYNPNSDSWSATSIIDAPSQRLGHTAVWTGSEMIVWGGNHTNTGSRYDPSSDSWLATSSSSTPSLRSSHTAIWTGSEMIVWGGGNNTGGRYNPISNSWSSTSTNGSPGYRTSHTAVWDGSEMIVWGGHTNTGGRYNPSTDNWLPTSENDAPSARYDHTAIWTGREMIVWGGKETFGVNTGGLYDPYLNNWTPTSIVDAPSARGFHTAIWTGNKMIVWGGARHTIGSNTGGLYNPSSDSWSATNIIDAPSERLGHTVVWTGDEMVIWGGYGSVFLKTGGNYNPDTDSWSATNIIDAPGERRNHTAIWTGSKMLIWGGDIRGEGDGDLYDPISDSWSSISSINEPFKKGHTAIWTGKEMIVWGGILQDPINTGSRYEFDNDSWQTMNSVGSPTARKNHTAVFTGTDMIVWGGSSHYSVWNSMGVYHVVNSFTLSGTLNSLLGDDVIIQNNNEDTLILTEDGSFSFINNIPENESYDISILSNPTNPRQICTVTNGSGINITNNVTDIIVDCELLPDLIYIDGFE